jgi:hypothetical protein
MNDKFVTDEHILLGILVLPTSSQILKGPGFQGWDISEL